MKHDSTVRKASCLLLVLVTTPITFATHRVGSVQLVDPPQQFGDGGVSEDIFTHPDPIGADPDAPGSMTKFLMLHFTALMGSGDIVEVESGLGPVWQFDDVSASEFWTPPMGGNLMYIRYLDDGDGLGSVVFDKYGRGEEIDLFILTEPLFEPLDYDPSDFDPDGICPAGASPSWENVACLDDDDPQENLMKQTAASVGFVISVTNADAEGAGCDILCDEDDDYCPDVASNQCLTSCTATLIESNLVLTARHCFNAFDEAQSPDHIGAAWFTADFLTDCAGNQPSDDYQPAFHKVDSVDDEGCGERDWSKLRLRTDVLGLDPIPIRATRPPPDAELFVIHHPQMTTKKVSRQPTDPGCAVGCHTDTWIYYSCDSDHGSSGSPVIDSDGSIVAVNAKFGPGCPDLRMFGPLVTLDVEESCSPEPDLDYVVDSIEAELPDASLPLGPEDTIVDITITYHYDGPKCLGAAYVHRVFVAHGATPQIPVGPFETFADPPGLDSGEAAVVNIGELAVPCPLIDGHYYVVAVELNYAGLPTEHDDFDDTDSFGAVAIGQACFPSISVDSDVTLTDADGETVSLCDGADCSFDEPLTAHVEVCNAGCAATGPFDLELWLYNDVLLGDLVLCADAGEALLTQPFDGLPAAPVGEPPVCEVVPVEFEMPVPRIPILGNFHVCIVADPGQTLIDCDYAPDIACTLPAYACKDPCIIDDDCVGGLFPPDGGGDGGGGGGGGDCFWPGCFPLVNDCGPGGWAYLGGEGIPCGDPRVLELFAFGQLIEDVMLAPDLSGVDQMLGALGQQIALLAPGPNVTDALRALAAAEVAGLAGRPDVAGHDLYRTLRFFNARDLDLRADGLEVPVSVPAGTNVSVALGGGISLLFGGVQEQGTVTPRFRQFGTVLPDGFHGAVPFYNVELESSVELAPGSAVTVTMDHSAAAFRPGAPVRMFHEEHGVLVDRTLTADPSSHTVVGQVYDFSRFMLLGVGAVTGITCPPDQVLPFPADTSPSANGFATAMGNGGPITISYDDQTLHSGGGDYTTTRTWTATDGFSGALCTQLIQLVDGPCGAALLGDIDCDNDVDRVDATFVVACLGGPLVTQSAGCTAADLNAEVHADLKDLAILQNQFTGSLTTIHDCCQTGTAGCSNTAIATCVCGMDPYCCDTAWDALCVLEVHSTGCGQCAGSPTCPPSTHGCFTTGSPGCTATSCCAAVCAVDTFCCQASWDGVCVSNASQLCCATSSECNDDNPCTNDACSAGLCTSTPKPSGTSCSDGAFCNGAETCNATGVCQAGTPPCTGNAVCDEANDECDQCNDNGDCNDGLFCNGAETCSPTGSCQAGPGPCPPTQVCNEANNLCGLGNHPCCQTGGPGCNDSLVQPCVCAQDPYCCQTAWDQLCVNEVSTLGCGSCGQGFNVDVGAVSGAGAGAPGATFSGAGTQPGAWNNVTGTGVGPFTLVDLNGAATGVVLTRNSGSGGNFGFNNANTSGDFEKLLDDGQNIGGAGGSKTYTFTGLPPGAYTLYTYAIGPDNAGYVSNVIVTGSGSPNPQPVGGPMPVNGFAAGMTHAVHDILVAPGAPLTVTIATATGFGTVNGFQLVPPHSCCTTGGPGCSNATVEACVCAADPFCCNSSWDQICVDEVEGLACGSCAAP